MLPPGDPPLAGILGRGGWSKLTSNASRGPATATGPDGMALQKCRLDEYIIMLVLLTGGRGGCRTPRDVLGRDPLDLIVLPPECVAPPVSA